MFNITSAVLIGTGAIYNQLGEALPKASIVTYIACFFFTLVTNLYSNVTCKYQPSIYLYSLPLDLAYGNCL